MPEIYDLFLMPDGFYSLNENDPDILVINSTDFYGIFMLTPVAENMEHIRQELNQIFMETAFQLQINGRAQYGILFACKSSRFKKYFAQLCELFILPANRISLQTTPWEWWYELEKMTGNTISQQHVSFVFSEFAAYLYLKEHYPVDVTWKSCGRFHDLEAQDGSQLEIKSTTYHHVSLISVSSEFQLIAAENVPFNIYFFRVEENRADGLSINDLIEIARHKRYDTDYIEEILAAQNINPLSPLRTQRFFICEVCKYDVQDPRFPKLSRSVLENIEGMNMAAVHSFTYEINLAALTDLRTDITEVVRQTLTV